MKLVVHKEAVLKVLPVCEELGLATESKPQKGWLSFDPAQMGTGKLRWLTRLFLLALGEGAHVEVYSGEGYVTYCFLKEEKNG